MLYVCYRCGEIQLKKELSASASAFNLPRMNLATLLGAIVLSFAEIFGIRKLGYVGYRVALFA